MPRDKLRRDLNETAFDIVRAATGKGKKPPMKRASARPKGRKVARQKRRRG